MRNRLQCDSQVIVRLCTRKQVIAGQGGCACRRRALQDVGKRRQRKISSSCNHQLVVEAITKGINKGEAIKWLCNKYGIDISQAIAMGDSENDIEMIKAAGLGIAVGNAMPNVKQSADFVADTNDNDAVAQVIYKFCLNKD